MPQAERPSDVFSFIQILMAELTTLLIEMVGYCQNRIVNSWDLNPLPSGTITRGLMLGRLSPFRRTGLDSNFSKMYVRSFITTNSAPRRAK